MIQILKGLSHIEKINQNTEVSVSLLGDETMRKRNSEFRGKNKTTDVLSFSQLEGEPFPEIQGPDMPLFLGDILISVPVCISQAGQYGHPVEDEFDRLMIHGLFHLLGYDHERSEKEEKIMFAKEESLKQILNSSKPG